MRKYNERTNVIGTILKKLRVSRKFSQTKLCKKLELLGIVMTKEDLSKIESGKKIVKDFEVWGIAKVLEVPLDELFDEIEKDVA